MTEDERRDLFVGRCIPWFVKPRMEGGIAIIQDMSARCFRVYEVTKDSIGPGILGEGRTIFEALLGAVNGQMSFFHQQDKLAEKVPSGEVFEGPPYPYVNAKELAEHD